MAPRWLPSALVTCLECGADYEGFWQDDSLDTQDRAEAPVATQRCPSCGFEQDEEYPGWSFMNEAG